MTESLCKPEVPYWRWAAAGALASVLVLAFDSLAAEATGPGSSPVSEFKRWVQPVLAEHCYACHGTEKKRGDLDLQRFAHDPALAREREVWEKVRTALTAREMPPEGKPQPAESARQGVVGWIDDALAALDANTPPNPGRVTARRLNRNEYRNTIRDLVGVDYDAHGLFPNDESGYGFDNIGDVLSLPPMLMEKYLAAAEAIARQVIVTNDPAAKRIQRVPANRFSTQADAVSTTEEEVWAFYREGEITASLEFPAAGEYRLRLRVYGEQAGPELPKIGVRFDGREIHVQTVQATESRPEIFEVPLAVTAGAHRLGLAYLNNFNTDGDRNLFLTSVEVVGPLGAAPEDYPPAHRRILPRRPAPGEELGYAAEVLRALAARAYRRPPTDAEVQRLVALVASILKEGGGFEEGIRFAVEAVLVSPHFLFRWELDPAPLAAGASRELTDYEVASRLSYFLWSSMPDDELFRLAAEGTLRRPAVLAAQVSRLLADPRSAELVRNFGGQWLQVRNLDQAEPDATIFPAWDRGLREAMRRETELFLAAVVREDRSVYDLIDADFTFLNERLARHYGISGVAGDAFQRVKLPTGSPRGGVLTQGSVLTITSVPTRTAPVLRGKWILEQILGTPPPPPPGNVPPLEQGEEAEQAATVRQRLELHRSKPECMGCHQKMDPLGFALENFDAIGRWRDQDGPHPVDTSAELPGGRKVEGAAGLKRVLRSGPEFPRALASKLLTYALGRGLTPADRPVVNAVVERLAKEDFRISSLLLAIVESDPFLKRQPQPAADEQHASLHP